MRARSGTAAAMCAAVAVACIGASPAVASTHSPIHVSIVSSSQQDVLAKHRIALKIGPRDKLKLARVYVSAVPPGKHAVAVVITRLREVHLHKHHRTTRINMKLLKAGRNALAACSSQRLVVSALPLKKSGGKPTGSAVHAHRTLKIDTKACRKKSSGGSGPPGGAKGGGPPGTTDNPIVFNTGSDFSRCDFTDPADCLFPFPNDWFTTADATTDTKRRVNFNVLSMPKNVAGKPIDPSAWNRNDGFSPGEPIVTKVPGLETKAAFDRTGIVPIDDMARAFDAQQPVVVIDAATKARHLVWAEVDANPKNKSDVTLVIRPGKNFQEGHRYVVALRRMRNESGDIIQPSASFRLYRDAIRTTNPDVERRRDHFESLFQTLAAAGIDRGDLYRAWDFTVASERNLSERMLSIRNDAFAKLGDTNLNDLKVQGVAPTVVVQPPTDYTPAQNSKIKRQVQGSVVVPCYLDAPACPSGSRFAFDPTKSNGPPQPIPGNTTLARFTCNIPRSASSATPARVSLYGHGLFGSRDEVNAGNVESMANEHDFVFCATDWIGMACTDLPPTSQQDLIDLMNDAVAGRFHNPPDCDVPNALKIETDLSNFPELADRVQQGMLNFLYLGRALIHPAGLSTNTAFKDSDGKSLLDTRRLFYDGNSQGGIIGGALMSFYVDGDRGVLGVPGMNYSTLLQRSSDFGTGQPPSPSPNDFGSFIPQYAYPLYTSYPNELQRQLILGLMQMLWDRSEADGYALHMTSDPYPNTPAHTILMHGGIGDHQVAQITAETEARTIGAYARFPYADPGRDLDKGNPIYGVPPIPSFPFGGSAIVEWDTGPYDAKKNPHGTPPPPNANVPPSVGDDPHEFPRATPAAREMKSDFLKIGGAVVDTCGPHPCYAWNWNGTTGAP